MHLSPQHTSFKETTSVLTLHTPVDNHQLNDTLHTLKFQKIMGCNTSRGATVVDPSETPEDRPKTATSTKQAPAEETNGTTEKEKDEKTKSSS